MYAIPTMTKDDHYKPDTEGIVTPHPHDILSGRGGASNNHPGNKIYRTVVEHNKPSYLDAPRHAKLAYATSIVEAIEGRSPPGRFLERKKGDPSKLWYEVTHKRAIDKTAQALREKVHKAIMLPMAEIPPDFHHLIGDNNSAMVAAAALAATEPPPKARKKRKPTSKKDTGEEQAKRVKLNDDRFRISTGLQKLSASLFGSMASGSGSGMAAAAAAAAAAVEEENGHAAMPPLPVSHNDHEDDPDAVVATALSTTPSMFHFFDRFRMSTIGGNSGAMAAAAAAAAASDAEAPVDSEAPLVDHSSSPQRKKKRPGLIRTAATSSARRIVDAQAQAAASEPLRETTLTSDISSILPSFLERGVTNIMDTFGVPAAPSLGGRLTSMFSGESGASQDQQVATAAAADQGAHIPLPMTLARPQSVQRANTLIGDDDDEEEDPSMERLRVIPATRTGYEV